VRQIVATRTDAEIPGDPAKMVAAMIGAAGADVLPPRLLLGSDAYHLAHAALTARLAFVEAQRDITLATDADDYADTGAGLASIER
jgi:hypothetical protein